MDTWLPCWIRREGQAMKKFALIGAAGFVAPRHMKAIKDTGNQLVAALDKNDSVGVIDSYFPDAHFFTEFERFDRHLEKRRREAGERVDYVSICSPNYLHDAHIRFALRIQADAICEKPVVLNPWNLDALELITQETGRAVHPILQVRLHPAIIALRDQVKDGVSDTKHDIEVTYIAPRGKWYMVSWKGIVEKSGGVATNIGVHFFDILQWIFGNVQYNIVHVDEPIRAAGYLELHQARVRWFLSVDRSDLPQSDKQGKVGAFRSIVVDGQEVKFSAGMDDLHTRSYEEILAGRGFSLADAKPAIEIVSNIRRSQAVGLHGEYHPFLKRSR
jgi:UDP-N-acetyl-2-amino-2-deoxyglucuronate dehydrogenase